MTAKGCGLLQVARKLNTLHAAVSLAEPRGIWVSPARLLAVKALAVPCAQLGCPHLTHADMLWRSQTAFSMIEGIQLSTKQIGFKSNWLN